MANPIIELAVRHVKEGRTGDFRRARAAFLAEWRTQPGVLADREFAAQMTLPQPLENVFLGMTAWNSEREYNAASAKFWGSSVMGNFMDTVEMPAFGLLSQSEGKPVDLSTLAAADGEVLEVAVRAPRGADVSAFDEARLAYLVELARHEAVVASYEFELLGEPADGKRVGMTVYSSVDGWKAAMAAAGASAAGNSFFSVMTPTIVAYVTASQV